MQNNTFRRTAYAKINLYLDVLDKMENGYHKIESVMQSVSLSDEITLTVSDFVGENEIEITSNSTSMPLNEKNLVYKAALRFLDFLKEQNTAEISGKKLSFHIEKNIPIEAGMAGGSSDCACALYLLNEAFGYPIKDNDLFKIGASLGADVAFCQTGGTSICRGIGDEITPLPKLSGVHLVCAIGQTGVSTPYAFGLLDEKYGTSPTPYGKIDALTKAISSGDACAVASSLFNKFEAVIEPLNESVLKIKQEMIKNGALGALMSGSGPSVFGIFANESEAKKAYSELKNKNFRVFLCKTV